MNFLIGAWKQMERDHCRWLVLACILLGAALAATKDAFTPLMIVANLMVWVGFGYKWKERNNAQ